MTPAEFIAAIAPAARASMALTKIPASFTIAQAADESGWGKSKTSAMANNIFNVKADPSWHGPVYHMASEEVIQGKKVILDAYWRMYPDWQSCFDDRAKFLAANPRYASCFKAAGGEAWALAIQAAGYATDPDYAKKLITIIRSHNLQQYDQP